MNPFKQGGQMLPIASINSVYVNNKKASDLFRPKVLIEIIEKNKSKLGIDSDVKGSSLLSKFIQKLASGKHMEKVEAERLAYDFGDRLASVLATLKKPSPLSISNRVDWTTKHWNYWAKMRKIYLVGGMTSPILTKIFYERIENSLKKNDIHDLQVVFIEESGDLGTKGLANKVSEGEYLLFDFGQTKVKKRHLIKKENETIIDIVLQSSDSGFLYYKDISKQRLLMLAKQLNNHVIATIYQCMKQVDFKGDRIHVAIANYVRNGVIYSSRGGYGKLALISDNYADLLSKELSLLAGRKIVAILHHDTSAMAYNFKKEPHSAVISLGTAFGVAFIDEK